jgi:hypothetical protein
LRHGASSPFSFLPGWSQTCRRTTPPLIQIKLRQLFIRMLTCRREGGSGSAKTVSPISGMPVHTLPASPRCSLLWPLIYFILRP